MKTIIVVCDAADDIAELRQILDEIYNVSVISTPYEAMARLRNSTKDVVAVLIDRPGAREGSRELIDYVSGENDYLFAIPILIITDETRADEDLQFLGKSAVDSIERPFRKNIVRNRLRRVVKNANSVSFDEFSEMLKVLPSMIYLKDAKSRYVFCSQIWHHVDRNSDPNWTIAGKTDLEIRKDKENAMKAMESDMEIIHRAKGVSYIVPEDNGKEYLQIIKEPLMGKDGRVKGIIALINDVTEQEMLKKELARIAATDKLTGLYNRRYGFEFLYSTHKKACMENERYAVFCIDLNHFKPVNDTYGHEMGDLVLEEMGRRLKELPGQFTSIRTGGDEFLVILRRPWDQRELKSAGDRLLSLFSEPVDVEHYTFHLSGSIGAAVYPDDADDPELLMKYADAAMYEVKHSEDRASCRFYDATMARDVTRIERLARFMKELVPERDLQLIYHPVFDTDSSSITGIKAALRLADAELSGYTHMEILNSAEKNGRLREVGDYIIQNALRELWERRSTDGKLSYVDIRILPLQVLDNHYVEMLLDETANCGLAPENVLLETEAREPSQVTDSEYETLQSLKERGFKLAVNGFTAENIDIPLIGQMNLDIIKLSGSITDSAADDSVKKRTIRATTAMAGALGITVVAVNVRDAEQVEELKDAGIHVMEGAYFETQD